MKNDAEVKLLLEELRKGKSLEAAAARAGMSERTARKYKKGGMFPSQSKKPRTHRTRPDPFERDWAWVQAELERDAKLQAKTLFDELVTRHPGRYHPGQLRTLQRQVGRWRALLGPDQSVMFSQVHVPGRMAQSDFTDMTELGVTIAGVPFPHLCYHMVLTYSNHEAVTVCFSETFEALAEGIETCLWRMGGSPELHRTDNLSAAVRHLDVEGRKDFTARYQGLMAHYNMTPTTNTAGESHQNGDVEQSHHRFKSAVDQALRLRGSRDFVSREAYEAFLQELVMRRNRTCQARFAEEREVLRPLPTVPLDPCQEVAAKVSAFSTIRVLHNTYSVPSRLIGSTLKIRVRAERLELYLGTAQVLVLPRLRGRNGHRVDYRHVIWSLVRKPGAFASYRYREELFPTLAFRRAYDELVARRPASADREYLRILHLAAGLSEDNVIAALELLVEQSVPVSFDAVKELVETPQPTPIPSVTAPIIDLATYDHLLPSRRAIDA